MSIPYQQDTGMSVSVLADLQRRWLHGEIDYVQVKAEIRRRCPLKADRNKAIRFINKVR